MNKLYSRERICFNCLTKFYAPKDECPQCEQPITSEFKSLYNESFMSVTDFIYFVQLLVLGSIVSIIGYFLAPEDGSLDKNATFVIVILSVVFGILLSQEKTWRKLGKASDNWPKTEGEIIVSLVVSSASEIDVGIEFRETNRSGSDDQSINRPSFHQLIVAKYIVNNVHYATGNIRFGSTSLVGGTHTTKFGGGRLSISDSYGSEDLSKYNVGSKVEVYYDPNDHQANGEKFTHVRKNAVVEPGYEFSLFSWNVFGMGTMLSIAILVLFLVFN